MELQPDRQPLRRTAIDAVPAPGHSFAFEEQKLQKLAIELQGKSFYQRLGVAENASFEEIKKAFIAIVKEFNPADKPPELQAANSEVIRLLREAKDTLYDPARRTAYDRMLHPLKIQPRDIRRMSATPPPSPRKPRFGPDGKRRF